MTSGKKPMIAHVWQLFIRWVELYTWRFILSLLLITFSIIVVWEPFWFVSALDALRIPYAVFLVAFVMFFFLRNNYALASAGGIALLIILPGIWPYFKTANEIPAEAKKEKQEIVESDLTVLHFNVKENNKKIETVAEAAVQSGAIIVSMQELKPISFPKVDTIMRSIYPYVYSELDYPGFGMALYAKVPFTSTETLEFNGFPVLHCTVEIDGTEIHLLAATTSTPTNDKDAQLQAKQFVFMSELVLALQGPLFLMGDMNSVPWSEGIEGLLKKTQLKDSRKDLSATYPAQSPLQIPIDYIFHSKEFTCNKFSTVGGTTSNHLGLMGYYTLRSTKKSKIQDDKKAQ
ncbi:MAG TPA: hypothetical protein PK511_03540 [Chitinophagales bacterium]|nr:hypothetical protein [Chitinophagales bacterium]HMX04874.1 hypothetical protein [Chitinophagales bacterium]HNI53568.1 hypothetical protein [Chitinophagales bacterium]HNJ89306.1 hypothetical protein [Chitinophagales bacterium]